MGQRNHSSVTIKKNYKNHNFQAGATLICFGKVLKESNVRFLKKSNKSHFWDKNNSCGTIKTSLQKSKTVIFKRDQVYNIFWSKL